MKRFVILAIFLALSVLLLPWLHPRAEAAVIGPDQARIAKFWIGKPYYDPRGGWIVDAIEFFKLWGVPEENMLYDPVRGGLAVRGEVL
jgi:hypothetical protein